MQQYFSDEILKTGDIVMLDDDTLYHLIKVLRKDSSYTFRICDKKGSIFHARLLDKKSCIVEEELFEDNELDHDVTCIMALIKSDKFEFCLQKLTELGVKRIVPLATERCVMKIRGENKMERFRRIIKEAAEQSHRNLIPELCQPVSIKDLDKYRSDVNYICYEAEKDIRDIEVKGSVSFIIGPEGGFSKDEYLKITELGFESVSLGKRILRAETAAMYMSSVIISKCQ